MPSIAAGVPVPPGGITINAWANFTPICGEVWKYTEVPGHPGTRLSKISSGGITAKFGSTMDRLCPATPGGIVPCCNALRSNDYAQQEPAAALPSVSRGRSIAGLADRKPVGLSMKPAYSTGMIGMSSGLQTWV